MISVSDILKILEQIPIWKRLSALPARIEALEKRIAALEAGRTQAGAQLCPMCGSTTRVVKEENDPVFGALGGKVHHLRCTNAACGYTGTRQVDPPRS